MPESARLGIDWGKARIGVAASNRGTTFAYPVETVPAGAGELARLGALVAEYQPGVIYVGLPLTLSGERAIAAQHVLARAAALAAVVAPVPVRLVDERMSTVAASRSLGSAGRRTKQQRSVIDQAAAVEILQRAIDGEERGGAPVGEPAPKEEP
ncbi:Holliday junction resolvase RuvX [Tessaracoccus sp. Z1128]